MSGHHQNNKNMPPKERVYIATHHSLAAHRNKNDLVVGTAQLNCLHAKGFRKVGVLATARGELDAQGGRCAVC